MEKMDFPHKWIEWIKMCHTGNRTQIILNGRLSKVIRITFSVRQGDPVALPLYHLYIEPLFLMIKKGWLV